MLMVLRLVDFRFINQVDELGMFPQQEEDPLLH